MHRYFRNWAKIKPFLFVGATILIALMIERARISGVSVPIPFLLLYASVVASGAAGGRLAGAISGASAAAYVVHAALVGFGPPTLTGGEIQVLFGALLYVGTGFFIGHVRGQRDRLLQEAHQNKAELESEVLVRTANLKRAEEELRASQTRLIDAIESIPDGFALFDADDRLVLCNQRYREVYPKHADTLIPGSRFEDMLRIGVERGEFEAAVGREEEWIAERLRSHADPQGAIEQPLSDGRWLRAEERRTQDGGTVGLRTDITDLKTTEQSLKENEERFRDFAETAADWFWEMNSELRFTYLSANVERIVGVPPEWHYGKSHEELLGDDYDRDTWDRHLEALRNRKPFRHFEYQRVGEGIEPRWLRVNGVPKFAEDGAFLGYRGTGSDVTEKRTAEEELRRSEFNLARAQSIARLGNWVLNLITGELYWSDEIFGIFHIEKETFDGTTASFYRRVHPDDREQVRRASDAAEKDNKPFSFEHRIVLPDGEERIVHERAEVEIDNSGKPVFLRGTVQDITEHRQAEERLRQAQKMEAVGQLTGGVAHDFNNLLAVILGNAELLAEQLGREDTSLDAILRATARGAELTQRLLAFSRQQSLRPQVIDLGGLVSGMTEMLTRALGETIEIETAVAAKLENAMADPGQVESALLNLALNARDAMPGGGKLTIECRNAVLDDAYVAENPEAIAGDYVVLAVSDQGSGMTAEVQAYAFEPFFTTKEVGQGSGLGLSMVYGFAKQSGGHAALYSEEGKGTTVKLYLPRAEQTAQTGKVSQDDDTPRGRGEVVLVIEDDPYVCALAARMLESLGYRVIDAPDAASAHKALAEGKPVDLVLSDVVLPGGASGLEFAEQARTTHPDLKVIFMSGYPAEAAKRNGLIGSDQVLLNKPFQRRQLARALREALG